MLQKSTVIQVLKLLLFIVLIYVLYAQVSKNTEISAIWGELSANIESNGVWKLIFVVLLMPINWALEGLKWQKLLPKSSGVSFFTAFRSILMGLAIGIITPQRIGEYGGRLIGIKTKYHWGALAATFVSSLSQNIVNIIVGITALILSGNYLFQLPFPIIFSAGFFSFIAIIFLLFIFYNIEYLHSIFGKNKDGKWWNKVKKAMESIAYFRANQLHEALFLSSIRYAVYLFQYALLLTFFGVQVHFALIIMGIAIIYLIQSSIPIPPVFGLFARAEIALLVWGILEINEIAILSATFLIWILNLVIPALIGYVILYRTNIEASWIKSPYLLERLKNKNGKNKTEI